jgi:hypothetical protein
MISVDNLYWILHEHLLRPIKLSAWYYYPWGTQQNLCLIPHGGSLHLTRHSRCDLGHVLFHFDQEPIYSESLGHLYDQQPRAWNFYSWPKFLANSEKSLVKKEVCRRRHFLDWHYFYHGWAALDWFRDAKYFNRDHPIDSAYLCLNHLVADKRSYRISLLARILDRQCTGTGRISFHGDIMDVRNELHAPHTHLSSISKRIIEDNLHSMISLPWHVDTASGSGDLSAAFGMDESALWQKSFVHVVTETVFYEPKLHLTEKIFKPIVASRPFVLVAAPGNLAYLREYGFRTFGQWIDESYDLIHDPDDRLDAIVAEIKRLQDLPLQELQRILAEMTPVLEHNRLHFFGRFREILVNEMVDNFDQCVRVWNNCRVDDKIIPAHPNLCGVKEALLI